MKKIILGAVALTLIIVRILFVNVSAAKLEISEKKCGESIEINGFEYIVNDVEILNAEEFSEKYDISIDEVQKYYDDSYRIFVFDFDIINIGETEVMPGLEDIYIQCFGYSNSFSYSMTYLINDSLIETIQPKEKIESKIPFAVSEKSFKDINSQNFYLAFYDDYVKYEVKVGEWND